MGFSKYNIIVVATSLVILLLIAVQDQLNDPLIKPVILNSEKPHVKVYDLNKPLEPVERFKHIECYPTSVFYTHNTTVCTHANDVYVSEWIRKNGYWEWEIMGMSLRKRIIFEDQNHTKILIS